MTTAQIIGLFPRDLILKILSLFHTCETTYCLQGAAEIERREHLHEIIYQAVFVCENCYTSFFINYSTDYNGYFKELLVIKKI